MADEFVVYNLEDDGTPTESVASQPPVTTGVASASTATQAAPSGSPASPITEGDVRAILHQELSHYSGDLRIGALLSGQVFILDVSGMRLGGTDFDTAPFSVDYDGNFTATNGYILGSMRVGNGATYIIIDGTNSAIQSSNYVAETTGWQIDKDGDADFNNARIRGRISTSVFVKDEVSAIGGQLLVANADVLSVDMTALDASTLTIKGDTTLVLNSILHLKDGTDDEYMRVTNIGSAPVYTVTRDLASAYSANANPAWKTGTAVVVEGLSDGASTYSGGFLKLLGAGTNSPKYSVFKRTGVAYNAITEYCTLGNLNGMLDYVAEDYGIAIGTAALGSMSFDTTNGLRLSGGIRPTVTAVAGENLTAGDPCVIRTNEIVKQVASHDARVLESSAGTNYGTGTTAIIGSTNTLGTGDSWFFIKFDLSTIAITTADSVMLRLRVDDTGWTGTISDTYEFGVYQVTGADWDESTITWTNKPAIDVQIDDWETSNESDISDDFIEEDSLESYVFLDITTLYNSWKGGTSNYGVAVRLVTRSGGTENAGAVITATVGTSENATAAFQPTLLVSGVSDNIGKAYKANSTNFTDLFGIFGICMASVSAATTATLQTGGTVTNQSGLTAGKTYYITDSETLSTTPGTLVREAGIALSATSLALPDSFQRIVSDTIYIMFNDTAAGHNSTNRLFIPLGFKPKKIDFFGRYKAAANTRVVTGIWQNGTQKTNANGDFVDAYLAYEVPTANETTSFTVVSVSDSGVLLQFQLKDDSTNVTSYVQGVLTFTL